MERGNVLLSQALRKELCGHLENVGDLFSHVKKSDPSGVENMQPDGLVMAGLAHKKEGRLREAEENYLEALEKLPGYADAHYHLGRLYHDAGRLDEAIAQYRQALKSGDDRYLTCACLGKALVDKSDYASAIPVYERALKLSPETAEPYFNLSYALRKAERYAEALEMVTRGLEIDPGSTLGHNRRGLISQDLDDYDTAEESYRAALNIAPDFIDALCNLGIVYRNKEKYSDAFSVLEKALELNPNHVESLNNLGLLYRDLGDYGRARDLYLKSLEVNPDYIEATRNLSEICYEMAEYEQAIQYAEQALKHDAGNYEVRWNLSHSLLAVGRLEEGWREYENRRFLQQCTIRQLPYKAWNGEALGGKTILVHAEQGLGDEIFFASCYQDVIHASAKCIIDCDPRLVGLFERSFPDAIIVGGRPGTRTDIIDRHGPVDFEIASGSLMRYFRNALDRFPKHNGFLLSDPIRRQSFLSRLQELGEGMKVGICWRSGMSNTQRNRYYMEIEQWLPILNISGIQFINLQYDDCKEELDQVREGGQAEIHHFDDLDMYSDIEGVCALIDALDLVISANTAVVSLAGALGKPVWCLSAPAWTRLGTDHQPVYPSLRPFYKSYTESWGDKILEVASSLDSLSHETPGIDEALANDIQDTGVEASLERRVTLQECHEGLLLFDEAADVEGLCMARYGEYAVNEIQILQPLLGEGATVLDVGAGIGLNTLRLSRLVGVDGRVISFEKDRLTFQRLCANLALNQVENVLAFQGGASVEDGDVVSIDELGLDACDLVCIRQAACPLVVLDRGKETIQRYKPFIYIREAGQEIESEIQPVMELLGYELIRYGISLYRRDNFLGRADDIFNGRGILGILCLPTPAGDV